MMSNSPASPLYNLIGGVYGATRRADPAICDALARYVGVKEGGAFLDVACGTGNYTRALAELGGSWHGVDISDVMLRGASAKSDAVEWRLASADALPYEEETFQGAICTLAIHHFPALAPAFGEIFRVLDEGSLVLFTAFPEQMRGYWLRHYFPEMMERSIRQMPSRDAVLGALGEAGFELDAVVPYHIADDLRDLFLYAGKRRPELYLDPVVRANISSFAALCSPEELAAGLQGLRDDIASGSLGEVAERYAGDDGDYAYVIARKRRR